MHIVSIYYHNRIVIANAKPRTNLIRYNNKDVLVERSSLGRVSTDIWDLDSQPVLLLRSNVLIFVIVISFSVKRRGRRPVSRSFALLFKVGVFRCRRRRLRKWNNKNFDSQGWLFGLSARCRCSWVHLTQKRNRWMKYVQRHSGGKWFERSRERHTRQQCCEIVMVFYCLSGVSHLYGVQILFFSEQFYIWSCMKIWDEVLYTSPDRRLDHKKIAINILWNFIYEILIVFILILHV